MNLSAIGVAKLIVSGVVGIGAGKIVKDVIKAHARADTIIDKVTIAAATVVLSGIISRETKKFSDEMVDDVVDNTVTVIEIIKENLTLAKVNRGEMTFTESGLDPEKFILNKDNKWIRSKSADDEESLSNKYQTTGGKYQNKEKSTTS